MARQVVHPCRTGNPGVVLHACKDLNSDLTLCGKVVDRETTGQPWGFRAVCTFCYPLKDPSEANVEAPKWEQGIRGREGWPGSSEEVLELSPDQEADLWRQAKPDVSPEQADPGEPTDQTPPGG